MTDRKSESIFHTTEFLFAAYLRAKGIIYLRTDWYSTRQATFVFKMPPENIVIAWQKADDEVSARALNDSLNFFRDELRRQSNA
uniref:DUF5659 domain-containing protein n=1 Tax=viral metagenome TaxID=1070528 RepID=A0A6M3JK97_9ZZZZ